MKFDGKQAGGVFRQPQVIACVPIPVGIKKQNTYLVINQSVIN
jgi:hypothetical protein